jgi:hypothetical protein
VDLTREPSTQAQGKGKEDLSAAESEGPAVEEKKRPERLDVEGIRNRTDRRVPQNSRVVSPPSHPLEFENWTYCQDLKTLSSLVARLDAELPPLQHVGPCNRSD